GAGPGDPGLITRRGLERLRAAEVVVYDRLVHPDLLEEAPPWAERIFVGKRPGREGHSLPQEQINVLLIETARSGRVVVRLKGGDHDTAASRCLDQQDVDLLLRPRSEEHTSELKSRFDLV